jgi:predicted MFS family arabinose efflux permease
MQLLKYWLPAVAGMFCLGLGAGLIGVFGFFVPPVTEEFGVGATVVNIGAVALLIVPGVVSPFVGKLADRFSARHLILVGVTTAVGALFLLSISPKLATIGLCFVLFSFGLTFYGPVVVNGLMVKRFPGQEARALAIVAIGISVASATLPPLVGFLLSAFPWRTALMLLGAGVWLILVVVAFTGIPAEPVGAVPQKQEKLHAGIYRRREFWLIGLSISLGLSVSVVLAIVYPPHFLSKGFSLAEVGWLMALGGLFGFVGKTSVAWFGDALHNHAKWLAASLLLSQVLGFGIMLLFPGTAAIVLGLCFLGFGGGAFIPMQAYLNSRYFDAAVISQVIGAQMPLFLPFGPTGIILGGYIFDQTGSYDLVLKGLAGFLGLAILIILQLPRPKPVFE